MSAFQALVQELQQEGRSTRRLLERVPGDQLQWRPHPKSMTLGQLAYHVGSLPGIMINMTAVPVFDATGVDFTPPQPATVDEILSALEAAIAKAAAYLGALDPSSAMEPWAMHVRGEAVLTVPRVAVLRSLLFNHWYHHRGQLTVYLRLHGVDLPSLYGPTADERNF